MKYIIIIMLSTLVSGCKKYELMTLQKENYIYKNIKLDGYFYNKIDSNYYEIFFLYGDGVFLSGGGMHSKEKNKPPDNSIKNVISLGHFHNTQYGWGIWKEENSKIIIEKWLSGWGGPYPVGRYMGDIINDSTINIAFTYAYRPEGNEEKKIFNFRQFSPKPDSTNVFIK